MALSGRSRAALYQSLSEIIDEEAVEEMLSHFPSRDLDEPITRGHLDTSVAELRVEVARLRGELREEIQTSARRSTQWMIGTMFALNGSLAAVVAIVA